MDDLSQKLTQILNDPGSMQQIMDMAATLGAGSETSLPPELPQAMTAALSQLQVKDEKQEALVHALMPYLRPGRRVTLERAVELARLSHAAGAALRSSGLLDRKEDDHV